MERQSFNSHQELMQQNRRMLTQRLSETIFMRNGYIAGREDESSSTDPNRQRITVENLNPGSPSASHLNQQGQRHLLNAYKADPKSNSFSETVQHDKLFTDESGKRDTVENEYLEKVQHELFNTDLSRIAKDSTEQNTGDPYFQATGSKFTTSGGLGKTIDRPRNLEGEMLISMGDPVVNKRLTQEFNSRLGHTNTIPVSNTESKSNRINSKPGLGLFKSDEKQFQFKLVLEDEELKPEVHRGGSGSQTNSPVDRF